jgi:hypothetical protein
MPGRDVIDSDGTQAIAIAISLRSIQGSKDQDLENRIDTKMAELARKGNGGAAVNSSISGQQRLVPLFIIDLGHYLVDSSQEAASNDASSALEICTCIDTSSTVPYRPCRIT